MKKILFLFLCFYTSLTYSQTPKEVVDYVNPFIGTALKGEGGTVPYVGTPFAMTSFLPQTRWEVWHTSMMMNTLWDF